MGGHRFSLLVVEVVEAGDTPTSDKKISSRVGCFSTYSTVAGGAAA